MLREKDLTSGLKRVEQILYSESFSGSVQAIEIETLKSRLRAEKEMLLKIFCLDLLPYRLINLLMYLLIRQE